jgi:RNAse (barnase) inhibitor barstar
MVRGIPVHEAVPWLTGLKPYFVSPSRFERLASDLAIAGFDVRILEGRTILGEKALHRAIGRTLSFPRYYGQNWDAFSDCIGDLAEQASQPLALIWLDAHLLLSESPHTFVRSVHLLLDTAKSLALSDVRFQFEVFFVGDF